MRTRSRRRLDTGLLTGGGLLVGGVAAAGAFFGNTEHIASMWVGAELSRDGSAAIREVIDYDFGASFEKHGILRDVPGLDPGSTIVVTSPNAPAGVAVFQTPPDSPSYPATRIRIGDPDKTVSGERRYLIAYSLDDIAPDGTLAWDAIGAGWDVPIEQAEIQVTAPWELTDVRCVQGGTGSTTACETAQPEPGRLVVQVPSLDAHQGVTVYASAGAPLEVAPSLTPPAVAPERDEGRASRSPRPSARARPSWARGRPPGPCGVAAASASASAARPMPPSAPVEPASASSTPTSWPAWPRSSSPRPRSSRPRKAAWCCARPCARSTRWPGSSTRPSTARSCSSTRAPARSRSVAATASATRWRHRCSTRCSTARQQLDLGTYDKPFAAGWSHVGSQLQHWADTSDLWDPKGDRRRVTVRVLGGIATLVGLLVTGGAAALAANASPWWLIAVAAGAVVAGVGLACAVRGWELRVRTPKGAGMWLRVESFRRFLAQSEGYHAEQAAARGVLREYTAWAVAVGEVDRWTRAVNSAVNIPDRSALTYVYLAPILCSATSSSSTAPSSSGGGGGGGVGGGGGGGGGGSW